MTLKTAFDLDLSKLSTLTLIGNMQMQKEMSNALQMIDSQDMLRMTCVSMYNEIAQHIAEADPDPAYVLLLNFLGLALESNMNIAEMVKKHDAQFKLFRDELKRRTDAQA